MTPATQPEFAPPASLPRWRWSASPLYLRVLLGVILGTTVGLLFRQNDILPGVSTVHCGQIAALYIQLLTALATPLIFCAILDAFVQTEISGSQGVRMFLICGLNIFVAFAIGLTILNVWKPGESWSQTLATQPAAPADAKLKELTTGAERISLSPLEMVKSYVPKSVAQPFAENMVLTVAVLAILLGAAIRSLHRSPDPQVAAAISTLEGLVIASYQIVLKILLWVIELAPFAICLAVAGVVGAAGADVFRLVGVFFVTVVVALGLHALVYYPLSCWWLGGKPPRRLFKEGLSAILTGFSINSSLATAPLTLDALRRLGVRESSARLSACVGTNFNNDGITLYEAITALFIAQAAGMNMTIGDQITILMAALAGSMGIAGIPNSGLIILTLVLKAARLPDETVQLALPIVYSIDFINARLRSAVNVMGDMQVAILLDRDFSRSPDSRPTA